MHTMFSTPALSRRPHTQRLLGLALLAALQLGLDLATPGANAAAAASLPRYGLQLLDNLPAPSGGVALPQVLGLNNLGQAAGRTSYAGGPLAHFVGTVWSADGAAGDIGRLPANWDWASAQDINDGGVVVGSMARGSQQFTAVRWTADGGLLDLGSAVGLADSEALAVNTIWQTVGTAVQGSTSQAALWQADGSYVNLGHLARSGNAGVHSVATGLNDNGTVAGYTRFQTADSQAWVWSPVTGQRGLRQAGLGSQDIALDVNAAGWVVGETRGAGGGATKAVAWDAAGQLITLHGAGYSGSTARDINDAGVVVGDGEIGGQARAWLWTADSGMVALDTLIDGLGSFRVQSAGAINAFGQIGGWGYDTLSGQARAFVLTPTLAVPEPGPAVLLCAGLLVLAWRRRAGAVAR